MFQATPVQSTATGRRTGSKHQHSLSSESLPFSKLHQIHLTFGLKEKAPISFCISKLGFLLFRFLLELVFSIFYNPVPYPIPSVWSSIFLCSSSRHFRSDFLHSVQLAEISVPAALANKTLSSFGLVLFHLYRTCGVYGKTCTVNGGTSGG